MSQSMEYAMAGGPELPTPAEPTLEKRSLLGRLTAISNNTKKVAEACYATTKTQIQSDADMLRANIKDGIKSVEDKYLIANQAFQNGQTKAVDGIRAGVQGATEQAKKLAGSSKEEGVDFISYTAEKFRDVTKKYKELPPKTKLAVGLTLTACGMWTGVLAGPAILSSTIAAAALAQRGLGAASTFMGLAEKLENIYAQEEAAGNKVSTGRKALGIGGSALISAFIGSGEFAKVAGEGLKTAASFVGEKMEALGVNAAVLQSVSAIKEKVAMLKMPQFGMGAAHAETLNVTAPEPDIAEIHPGLKVPQLPEKATPTAAMPGKMDYAPGQKFNLMYSDDTIDTNVKQGEISKPAATPAAVPIISDDVINDVVKKKEAEWDAAKAMTLGQEEAVDVVKPSATQAPVASAPNQAAGTPLPATAAALEPIQFNENALRRPIATPLAPAINPVLPVPDIKEPNITFNQSGTAPGALPQPLGDTTEIAGTKPLENNSAKINNVEMLNQTLNKQNELGTVRPTSPSSGVIDTTQSVRPQASGITNVPQSAVGPHQPPELGSAVNRQNIADKLNEYIRKPTPGTLPELGTNRTGAAETVASAVRPSAPGAINPFAMAEAAKLVNTEAVKNTITDAVQSVFLDQGSLGNAYGSGVAALTSEVQQATKFIQSYVTSHPTMTVEALLAQKDGSPEFKTLQKTITEIINKGGYGRDQITAINGKTLLDFFKLK